MLFNTAAFAVFLVVVVGLTWAIEASGMQNCWRVRLRRGLLLLASYWFYACWDPRFLGLIVGVTLLDWLAALALARLRHRGLRLYMVAVTVGLNLGLLGFWKYTDFFLRVLAPLYEALGRDPLAPLGLVLPVGISFFTFQGLSYVIDVYRGDVEVERSPTRFALFIAFFPQLVAGPIMRASQLLPQLDRPGQVDATRFGQAVALMIVGLLKKVVMADYLAANLVDRVFDLPERFSSVEVLVGVYGYALQIYGDFSGYCDMAIGAALLLGIQLPINFDAPYRAASLREFWRRWHITLSQWLRDYLYISLGGSRGGRWRTYRNLFLTMLLGGLWHGAAYDFVIWGAFHGAGLAAERILRRNTGVKLPPWLGVLATFHVVCALWVFFRAETFAGALRVFAQLGEGVWGVSNLTPNVVALVVVGFIGHFLPDRWWERGLRAFVRAPVALQAAAAVATLHLAQKAAESGAAPFIYFQF
ncbi:MAG TPA: MBOAT family protein [Polyangiaceae bacterium]|nr:MBOAT family protein [Polyangiaceae bacterium]